MQWIHRRRPIAVALLLTGTVLLCSGAPTPATAIQPAVTATQGCDSPAADRASNAVELELLAALNAERQANGLSALAPSPALMRAARWKAADLAATVSGVITDADLDDVGRRWPVRLVECGYPDSAAVGESLGQMPGGADVAGVLKLWLDAAPNARLLLDPDWRAAGVAAVEADDYTFWVLDLGDTAP
jgi:uncharacterized protein YkwD